MQIEGATVLVTGANGDIGKYYVKALSSANAGKIYAAARKRDSLTDLVNADPEKIIPIELDITNPESVASAAQQCEDVTLLINNAGIGLMRTFIAAEDIAGARTEIEVNYLGTLSMCRAFAPILKQNGGGAIINMLSILGKINFPMNASYSASKAAAISMTQGIRTELAQQGTLVVGVMPGTVDTKGSAHWPEPKVSPAVVVQDALQGVIEGEEDIYPGEQAKEMVEQLRKVPKALEKAIAKMVSNT
ncbi:MAG: SDR family oxidoreductase [Phormidesmis sp.]